MAEVQTTTQSGEMAQRFIEFVMMQAQQVALFLGQIPNPQTGQGEVNLELAKMFIDQLAMIQEKTRGNLSKEEDAVLRNALSNLQMAFVDVSQHMKAGGSVMPSAPEAEAEAPEAAEERAAAAPESDAAPSPSAPEGTADESENKKRFTKSYGS